MKPTSKTSNGTSFHGSIVRTTLNNLKRVLGTPHYIGDVDDKVQNEWILETNSGEVFTVYDWKEYRHYKNTEVLEWHIGGHSESTTELGKFELINEL